MMINNANYKLKTIMEVGKFSQDCLKSREIKNI